jgi:hypothetical protein
MNAERMLEKYCNKNKIDYMKFTENEWDEMVQLLEDELVGYITSSYVAGIFNGYLDHIISEKVDE